MFDHLHPVNAILPEETRREHESCLGHQANKQQQTILVVPPFFESLHDQRVHHVVHRVVRVVQGVLHQALRQLLEAEQAADVHRVGDVVLTLRVPL